MDRNLLFEVAGLTLRGMKASARVAVSELFEIRLDAVAVSDGAPSADALAGEVGKLAIIDGRGETLEISALVVEAGVAPDELGMVHYDLILGPEATALTLGRDSRVFQDMTAVEIIEDVFGRAGLSAVKWCTTGTYRERSYCAQYRESDWDFVSRLCAEEGLHYYYDFTTSPTTLVLADDSAASDPIVGGEAIAYREEAGLRLGDAVSSVRHRCRRTVSKVSLRDYNFETPSARAEGEAGEGQREIYDSPGRVATSDEANVQARLRLEAEQVSGEVITGKTRSHRMHPGRMFTIEDHPAAALNVSLFCTETCLTTAEGEGVEVMWTAIPLSTPYRAARAGVTRSTGGPQCGVVCGPQGSELHSDDTGRVRVQFYWDREGARDDKASTPMRVGQFPTGGSMVMPRVGWEVFVHHHEDDVDAPVVTSHLYDGKWPVPYPLPANKTRTAWQTATTPGGGSANEIRFEDAAGSEELFINASYDMNVVVANDMQEKTGVDYTHDVGANLSITVGGQNDLDIGSNQAVTVGASERLTISSTHGITVGGAETNTIGASRTLTTIKGQSASLKGGRTLTVGGSQLELSALENSRTALGTMSTTVGGAVIAAAATGVEDLTVGASTETVGGAKVWAGAQGCSTTVKGALAETVGGAYVVAAGGDAGESAGGSMAITVGGAFLGNSAAVEIEAESSISIRVGGTSLKITSGAIEVKAPLIASPAGTIKKKGSQIKHN